MALRLGRLARGHQWLVCSWCCLPAEIYAIDEPESTVYVLIRDGMDPVLADWPHPLRELCPEARYAGTLGSEEWQHANAVRAIPYVDPFKLELKLHKEARGRKSGTVMRCWDNRGSVWPGMNGHVWVVECADHRHAQGFEKQYEAIRQMTRSVEWCPECGSLDQGMRRTQVRGDTPAIEVLSKLEALYGPSGGKEK